MDVSEREWRFYELLAEETRQQVDRGWSHIQFFVLLNATILGGAITLAATDAHAAVIAMVLLGGALIALAGVAVLHQDKKYYRTLSARRTACEEGLGLARPIAPAPNGAVIGSLSPTMDVEKKGRVLRDPASYIASGLRLGSVTGWGRSVLLLFAAFDVAGAVGVALGVL